MPELKITHQSVRDYIAARKRGDRAGADRIAAEVTARYDAGRADGGEIIELGRAAERVRLGAAL
jgi:hypothetical protein